MNTDTPVSPARHEVPRRTLVPEPLRNIPHGGLALVLALIVVYASLRTDAFLSSNNLLNVLRQVSVLMVLASGLTLLMTAGGMDFSMGSTMGVTVSFASQLIDNGHSEVATIFLSMLLATVIGLVNGVVVTYAKVAPFVVTLATATILDGIALLIIDGMSISIGTHLSWLGGDKTFGIPNLVYVALAVLVVVGLVMQYTIFGRDAFAIGGNEDVARLSGIRVDRDKLVLYALSGALAGVAGIMLLARLAGSSPNAGGLQFQLQAVAAVVIGGTSLAGGKGTIVGTFFGVILLGVVANVLNLLGINNYYQTISVGAVLLIAAVANLLQGRSRR
ncbi:ABC transporter permease [Actinocorallia longicatena]|uniref:Ribose ABC transporter permease n=1 Tax=Actinocorallia longicatena TaxID=111803 RepID=A0ABP6Q7S3_9ACTN